MQKANISCTHMLFNEAKEKLKELYSCLEVVSASEHVAVSPRCIGSPKDIKAGIKTVLDGKLNTFSARHNGVPVAYGNITWLDSVGRIHADNPLIHFSVALDFIIFRPKIGSYVCGTVNKVSSDHLGVLIHSIFNASILKRRQQGASDLSRKKIKEGEEVIFEITGMHVYNSLLAIEGKLVDISRLPEMAKETTTVNASSLMSNVSDTVGVKDSQQKTNGEYLTDMRAIITSNDSTLNTSVEDLSELPKLRHLDDETQYRHVKENNPLNVKKTKRKSEINNQDVDLLLRSSSSAKKKKKKRELLLKEDYNSEQTVTSAFVDDSSLTAAVESEKKKRNRCLQKIVCAEEEKLDSSAADLRRKKEKRKKESFDKDETVLDSSVKVQELGKKKRHKKDRVERVSS